MLPSARYTSDSTVGLPRESRISLPTTLAIAIKGVTPILYLRHHHDAGVGHLVALGPIRFQVVTDDARFRNFHIGVNDGSPDPAITPDLGARHQDRILDFAITVDTHARRQDTVQNAASGDDATSAHHR